MNHRRYLFTLAVLLLASFSAVWAADVAEVRVDVLRGAPVDASSVLSFVSLEAGKPFSRAALAGDVRALEATGRFALVEAAVEETAAGLTVVYRVEPKPYLAVLRIVGTDGFSERKVRSLLELEPGTPVDDGLLAARARKVEEAYRDRHYPDASVSWEIETDGGGAAGVTVRVREGRRARARRFSFEGNRKIEEKALRGVLRQKRAHFLAWLTGAGKYDPDAAESDRLVLLDYYLDRGYLDARVEGPAVLEAGARRVELRYRIHEGERYTFGSPAIEGVAVFPEETLRAEAAAFVGEGEAASVGALRAAAAAVREVYQRNGYYDSRVDVRMRADSLTGLAAPLISVREGRLSHLEDIRFRGNTRTQDKVLRRELAVMPGDAYNQARIRTSERRLLNLGYFSLVHAQMEPTIEPDRYNLVFDVEEQHTGQFMIGAGFSSVDDLVGFMELSQGNFDLFGWPRPTGAGQKVKLRGQFGTKRSDMELSFVEPWLFNRKLALGVDFYRNESRFLSDDYDQRTIGAGVSLSRALFPFVRGTAKYAIEEINVFDVAAEASPLIREEEGRRTKSSVTLSVTRDSRDQVFVPTRGHQATLGATLAGGALGGNTDLYRLDARAQQYIPLWFSHVLSLRLRASVVEEYGDADRVPIFDRVFLGGATTVRGFRYRDVGPRDESGEPVGGRSLAFASAEYTIPLARLLRLAFFHDAGMVWEEAYRFDRDINSSYGFGLRIDMQGFPLRLDYGWPLKTDEFNDRSSGRFTFLLGYGF